MFKLLLSLFSVGVVTTGALAYPTNTANPQTNPTEGTELITNYNVDGEAGSSFEYSVDDEGNEVCYIDGQEVDSCPEETVGEESSQSIQASGQGEKTYTQINGEIVE